MSKCLASFFALTALLSSPAWSAGPSVATPSGPAVAATQQPTISQEAFTFLMNEQIARGASDSQQLRQAVRNELIVQTVLSQQSLAQKLDQSPQGQMLLETVRRNALVQLWQQDWLQKNPVSRQALEDEYKSLVGRLGPDEFQVRHVLLRDETAARLVLEKAKAGASLAALAQEFSSDEGTRNKGGLLDWVSPALMVPGLGDAIKGVSAPKLLDVPVQSQAGWHVVRVEAKRSLGVPAFESLQPLLTRVVTQRQLNRAIQELLNQARMN